MIHPVGPRLYAIAALLLTAGAAAPAQTLGGTPAGLLDTATPAAARRVAASFEFEPIPGDTSTLPANWIRAQHDPPNRVRPGFPIWNRGVLDREQAHSGSGSVRLDLEGGSASLLLDPGLIQVFPDADYAVVARVRTRGVDHARARLVARLLDREGDPVPGSEVSSAPTLAQDWSPVVVRVPGDFDESVSLQIELLFEQPGPDPDHPDPALEIVRQDFQGSAWFDDISVLQIPRVEAWVEHPGNLIPGDEPPAVGLFVRDLVAEPLRIRYELRDHDGALVDEYETAFVGGRLETEWTPEVDRFGWYGASVAVLRGTTRIGSAETAFIWAPPRQTDAGRVSARGPAPFSLSVAGLPDEGLHTLGDLALDARIPRVLTRLDDPPGEVTPERVEAVTALAGRLSREGSELGLAIGRLPESVSAIGGPTPVLRALADDGADGADWIEPLAVDLGHRVRWWRVGAFDETLDALAIAEIAEAIDRLGDLVPGAVLETPWSSFDAVGPAAARSGVAVAQTVDPSIIPGEVAAALSGVGDIARSRGLAIWDRPDHTAVFRAGGDDRAAIDEMLLSALHAWIGFTGDPREDARGRSLRLHDAWRWRGGRRPQLTPGPSGAAWLTLVEMLRDRRGEILPRVAPGIGGALLTPNATAPGGTDPVAVFWPEPAPEPAPALTLLLASGAVERVDIFGNRETLEPVVLENSSVRAHTLALPNGPVFVRGVDPELLRFLASVRLEPSRVRSDTEPQEVALAVDNPWRSSIQGEYFILEPGNLSTGTRANQDRRWGIDPRFGAFAIAPGAGASLPVEFDVSPAVGAGPARLVVDIDLSGPTASDFVRVERTIEVGLDTLRLHLLASYDPDPSGETVVVFAVVENTGATSQNITLKVDAPGFSPQRSAPTAVPPGRRVVKSFPFPEGRALLAGREVVAGLTNRETGERVRTSIPIDGGR
jgi:hypothetical protein